ncbi:PRC-barrel domain containing protein [Erythrobacter sp. YJ-T3-07]|uniref:PRC-barrel domain containing protein n=1 Tax=Erythrobacter sp. YJ-T3-07 TaxID=2793063 RepID=UPI001F350FA8|nr:PRC-barrel domain containing protein [Erythrobacter sp. YJ-T3-07]
MQILKLAALPLAALAITACESEAEKQGDIAEDRMKTQAEQSAAAAGMEEAALGMTELQLIDADLVAADGTELGDIEAVHRDASGAVDGLFVELDNTDPDRFVMIPLDGLSMRMDGDDKDVQTGMTAQDLAALPDAQMPAAGM